MAGEITVQQTDTQPDGSTDWSLFFFFDISESPIVDNDAVKIVLQTTSQLPTYAATKLSQAQKDAINAGDAAFMQYTIRQTPGESQANFIARVEAAYTAVKAFYIADKQADYSKRGLQRTVV